jgi:hypothetical protein
MGQSPDGSGGGAPRGERRLWGYRIVVGLLLATIAGGGAWARSRQLRARAEADPFHTLQPLDVDVGTADVGAVFDGIRDSHPTFTDRSVQFFSSREASVHMHLIGPGQTCPLHIHPGPDEVTVIVGGDANVTHVHGVDGKAVTQTGRRSPGMLVRSPAYCGHEWVPASPGAVQGNLVFASPLFQGNYYLKPDDPRLLQGSEPFFYEPAADLEALTRGSEARVVRPIPGMNGRMSVLLIKGDATIEAASTGPVVGYVLAGSGALDDGHRLSLRERTFLTLRGKKTSVPVHADPGHPLAILRLETALARAPQRRSP